MSAHILKTLFLVLVLSRSAEGQGVKTGIIDSELVNKELDYQFYNQTSKKLFWLDTNGNETDKLKYLLGVFKDASYIGLNPGKYNLKEEVEDKEERETFLLKKDYQITDRAISLCLDLIKGPEVFSLLNFDEISPKYQAAQAHTIITGLMSSNTSGDLNNFFISLQPPDSLYLLLLNELRNTNVLFDSAKKESLVRTIQLFRWIHYFHLKRFVVVNIPSATLYYFEQDSVKIKMKVVVGKPSTRTPRFAAYCDQIILYPYWNIPNKIAVSEFLPLLKKNPALVDAMNLQIVSLSGEILNPEDLNWKQFSKSNFPYRIRQSTGCDNALGVVKFNLTSPFGVYLHDTNMKSAFKSTYRFYSHGCIRVEKPIELAEYFLPDGLDTGFLKSCLRNQKPMVLSLKEKVPVFVIYSCIGMSADNKIFYFKDIYGLEKSM